MRYGAGARGGGEVTVGGRRYSSAFVGYWTDRGHVGAVSIKLVFRIYTAYDVLCQELCSTRVELIGYDDYGQIVQSLVDDYISTKSEVFYSVGGFILDIYPCWIYTVELQRMKH